MIDIIASVDQERLVVEARNPMTEAFAAYLVARYLIAVANPVAVGIVQAEIESVASIAAAVPEAVTAAVLEKVTNLMRFAVIVAELEPSIVVRVQSAGLFACQSCQTEVQGLAAVVTRGHYFPIVDVYLIGCFADLLAAVVASLKDYSAG